jgi:addiction module HigA family antidote
MHIENVSAIVHPGRIILEDFLAPRGISVSRLANDIGIPARRIYEFVQGQRSINSDLAHRLAHYFGMSERYWLELQLRYDRDRVKERSATVQIKQIVRRAG